MPRKRSRRRTGTKGLGILPKTSKCVAYQRVRAKGGKVVRRCKAFATPSEKRAAAAKGRAYKSGRVACKTVRKGRACARVCFASDGKVYQVTRCAAKRRKKSRRGKR